MIRLFQQGDAEQINSLYQRVFGKTRSIAEWEWKFQRLSSPPAIIIVAEEEGEIVGHAACLKIEACYRGKTLLLAERVDIMVDPAFQGRGIYKKIVARMLEECESQNIDIVYGFPAPKAKDIFLSAAKADDLGNVPRFLAVNKPGTLISTKKEQLSFLKEPADKLYSVLRRKKTPYHLRELGPADLQLVDELYERYAGSYPLHAKRGSDYVKRRYLDHPERDYRVYALSATQEDYGYVVLHKETAADGITFETIVDLWGPSDSHQLSIMLRAIRSHSQADAMNVWAVKDSARYEALKKAGFFHINSPMPFVIKTFNSQVEAGKMAGWHLSQSDVDSY
ncbi:GNAT family N-acetyltransferase [Planococcus shenhongbingii]|uniref:GNAT family N-acetyltransferase n=1 Tax=Planococcus shenhongbingii TaxID=3058398 RepID=A0ABT8NAK9_9BACL|nr:GNAT family N-acetyltransferase [Planococcus sp. N017]MDN7244714.1 GNAT family N-acetyltransferase [Planococcus sp. N017]